MASKLFPPQADAVILERYPIGGTLAVMAAMKHLTPQQVVSRVAYLRKTGVVVGAPPAASPNRPEEIIDGYDNVPYWCRLSTRKQSAVEPRYLDGITRHVAVRFEYDEHVEHSKWFKEKARWS